MFQLQHNHYVHIDEKSLLRIDLQFNKAMDDPKWDLRCFFAQTEYHIVTNNWSGLNLYDDCSEALKHFMLIKHQVENYQIDVMKQHFLLDIKDRVTTKSLFNKEQIAFTNCIQTKDAFAIFSDDSVIGFSKTKDHNEVKEQFYNEHPDECSSFFGHHVYWHKVEFSFWSNVYELFQDNQSPKNVL